jgi:hypothetical protein
MNETIKNIDNVDVLLEGLDDSNISSIVKTCNDIANVRKKLEQVEEMLKNKIKIFLKEHNWTTYNDTENKTTISLVVQRREDLDKALLKTILSDEQLAQVTKVTTFEKLLLVNPETRERMKKYVLEKKK